MAYGLRLIAYGCFGGSSSMVERQVVVLVAVGFYPAELVSSHDQDGGANPFEQSLSEAENMA